MGNHCLINIVSYGTLVTLASSMIDEGVDECTEPISEVAIKDVNGCFIALHRIPLPHTTVPDLPWSPQTRLSWVTFLFGRTRETETTFWFPWIPVDHCRVPKTYTTSSEWKNPPPTVLLQWVFCYCLLWILKQLKWSVGGGGARSYNI